jgi:hypothetical protein
MTQGDNILQELNELNSKLANHLPQNVYTVPVGYFEGLATQVISRVKAMEAITAAEELGCLSPALNKLTRQTPYSAPAGYFEELPTHILNIIKADTGNDEISVLSPFLRSLSKEMPYTVPAGFFEGLDEMTLKNIASSDANAADELASISPFLSGLKKEMPYSVPAGYFENLSATVVAEESKPAAKVISLGSRKWFRYAAAAVVVGVIATIGLVFINRDKVTADKDSYAWIKENTKKVSTEKLEEFVQLADVEKSVASTDSKIKQEVKELMKDVPATEIQSLLNDTEILSDANEEVSDEEVLMN